MDQEKIGKFIARCRKENKLTQAQLAEKLNVSDKSISRWENGKTMPDISLFEPLCEILNISIIELLKAKKITNEKEDNKISVEVIKDYSKYIKRKNKKIILTILFIMSLSPMLLNQYGGMRNVQEISGLINLINPIGIISVILFMLGVWLPIKKEKISKLLGGIGVIGIVISEIYKFFTWHIANITGEISIQNSIEFAFIEFYIGLAISLVMVFIYFFIDKIIKE